MYDTATRFVSTHLLLYYCIAVARSWVGKLVRRWVVGSVGGWTSERVCGFRCLTCFALLFAGSMVLSPLDDGALRTNWIHIYCCCTSFAVLLQHMVGGWIAWWVSLLCYVLQGCGWVDRFVGVCTGLWVIFCFVLFCFPPAIPAPRWRSSAYH